MEKRCVAFGFDDGRPSDFAWVAPLFTRHGARATFNIINAPEHALPSYVAQVNRLLADGHEIGDHTVLHHTYMYELPCCDGRTTPSNDDLRRDRGDGCNAFHSPLDERIRDSSSQSYPFIGLEHPEEVTWGSLTDGDCDLIRQYYGIWGCAEAHGSLLVYLDELSARYCGTEGESKDPGSWNGVEFTRGIFAGCRTTSNHEIWERLLDIQQRWYTDNFHMAAPPTNWSQPGGERCPCLLYYRDGHRYADRECTIPGHHYGKLVSTRTGHRRSWADLLRGRGYATVSDSIYESQNDGSLRRNILVGFHWNAHHSKDDLVCREPALDRLWFVPSRLENPAQAPLAGSSDWLKTIYETDADFKEGIDGLVRQCAEGRIPMGLCESIDTFGARLVYDLYLQFCRKAGIASITLREAFDLAFRHPVTTGNLFGNPRMARTVEAVIGAVNAPPAPDGWSDGAVEETAYRGRALRALALDGIARADYLLYGVPPVKLTFSFLASSGTGASTVTVRVLRNIDPCHCADAGPVLATLAIADRGWHTYNMPLVLKDAPRLPRPTALSPTCDGLDEKICGLAFILTGEGLRFAMPELLQEDKECANARQ